MNGFYDCYRSHLSATNEPRPRVSGQLPSRGRVPVRSARFCLPMTSSGDVAEKGGAAPPPAHQASRADQDGSWDYSLLPQLTNLTKRFCGHPLRSSDRSGQSPEQRLHRKPDRLWHSWRCVT
jgi:hypothetical protein